MWAYDHNLGTYNKDNTGLKTFGNVIISLALSAYLRPRKKKYNFALNWLFVSKLNRTGF